MMRKILAATVLAAVPLAGGVAPALASPPAVVQAVTTVTQWVKPGVTLNVRSGPGTSYSKVATVSGNTTLTGVITNGWMKITSGSLTGRYVSSGYLTTVNPNPSTVTRWVTGTASLNVRSGPSTSYSIVGTLTRDQQVVGTISNGWMKITSGSYSGRYVSATYLTATKPGLPPSGPVQMWVKPGGPANVYTSASTSSSVAGSLYGNVAVSGTVTNGWLKLSTSSYSGKYMPVTSLTTVNPAPEGAKVVRWVQSGPGASVRQAASTTSTKLATLPYNTQVEGTASKGWVRISAGGHLNHYVPEAELTATKPAAPVAISNVPPKRTLGPYPTTLTNTPEWKCQVKSGDAKLQEWPAKVRTRISKQFGITNIGGYRATATGEHGLGLALDVMTPSVSAPVGDDVAAWTVANASKLNVKYVIWKQAIWQSYNGWQPMADRGDITQNHYDHVHISFNSGSGTCPS